MRKAVCLLIALLLLTGCSQLQKQEAIGPTPEAVEKKDYSEYAGIVADTQAWYDEFTSLPIANENMTQQELRQLCVDAFRLNMTMPWTPTEEISYHYTLLKNAYDVTLPKDIAYSGLCYATGIENATYGNAWKMLPYWDPETGALDVEAVGKENVLNIISSACSYGAMQGWNRVSNSHGIKEMDSYSMYISNIVPVGPYEYESYTYNHNFKNRKSSDLIIAANGEQTMYESYACTQLADGVFSSSAYHVMMISQAPVVVRNPDGTIDPEQSYVYVHEQRSEGTRTNDLDYTQENGVIMRPLGTINKKYTFAKLLEKGYIPFTVKELIGQDPIEPGKAWLGTQHSALENGTEVAVGNVFCQPLHANYNICTIQVEVKAPDGTVLVSYSPFIPTNTKRHDCSIIAGLDQERLTPYANGENTLHIYARLSNGELVEAFHTVLKMK